MPAQEPGVRPARPLPCQPNAYLAGFTTAGGTVRADLALSNGGGHVSKASHFAVYDNTQAPPPRSRISRPRSLASTRSRRRGGSRRSPRRPEPSAHAGTTTSRSSARTGSCAGSPATSPPRGRAAQVTADYYTEGGGPRPALTLTLANGGTSDVTFTVTPDHYSADPATSYRVPAGEPGRLPTRPPDDLGRLVRPDGHDRRRRPLVAAVHRAPGDRRAQRHRLTTRSAAARPGRPGTSALNQEPLVNGDVAAEAAEAAGPDQVVDEGVGPAPRPGEPAARLRSRGRRRRPGRRRREVGEGVGRVGRGGGRALVGLVPAGKLAVVPVAFAVGVAAA